MEDIKDKDDGRENFACLNFCGVEVRLNSTKTPVEELNKIAIETLFKLLDKKSKIKEDPNYTG